MAEAQAVRARPSEAWAGRRALAAAREERGVVAAIGIWLVFALNFGDYKVVGDGIEYYSLVERLFGDRPEASGYNFGTGLLNAPFYGAAKLVEAVTPVSAAGTSLREASITVASIFYIALAAVMSAWILRRLDLPHRGLAVGAALFGSPLWYYGSFSPSYTHAADAATFALIAATLLVVWERETVRAALVLGAGFGLAVAVRPYNAAIALGAVVVLTLLGRRLTAMIAAGSSVLVFAALAAIPLAVGAGLTTRVAGTPVISGNTIGLAPLTPLRMLFTEHRGLFVWTPVTLLAVVGVALLLRRFDGLRHRFLLTMTVMVVALLAAHLSLTWWDGGWSFSMRYFASPLPFYAVGVAGLVALAGRWRHAAVGAIAAGTAWSLVLGMNHAFGASMPDGAIEVVTKRSPAEFVEKTWDYSRFRHVVERVR